MKVFRKITPGRNPDVEIHEALTKADNEHVAALYGWLETPARDSDEPMQLPAPTRAEVATAAG